MSFRCSHCNIATPPGIAETRIPCASRPLSLAEEQSVERHERRREAIKARVARNLAMGGRR